MRISKAWITVPLVLLFAGCPGEDPAIDEPFVTEAPMAPPEEPAAPVTESAEFQEVGGSGMAGEVMVTDRGDRLEVMVHLRGAPADSRHPGHIHSGSCDDIGGVVQALEPIETDAAGSGMATVAVDVPPMQVMDGQHVVVYHGADGAPAACAPIRQHQM